MVIIWEYQNIKTFLQKLINQIGQKKFFLLKKIKNTVPSTYLIEDLNGEKILETFYDKDKSNRI